MSVEKTSKHLALQLSEYNGEGKFYAEIINVMDFQSLSKEEAKFRLSLVAEIIEDGSTMPDSVKFKENLIELLRKNKSE